MRWDNCWIITLSTSHLCNIYKPVMATQNHSSLSKSDLAHTSCVQNIHFCSCPHDHACIRINIQYCCIPKHQCMSTLRKNSNFITFCSLACLDYSCLYQLCYRCSWNDATLCDMAAVRRTKVWFTGRWNVAFKYLNHHQKSNILKMWNISSSHYSSSIYVAGAGWNL